MNFISDTASPAHPAILEAMAAASHGMAASYGADDWTTAARKALCEVFETDLEMWLVSSGTAANALGLSVLCPPTGSVVCHREAHIEQDERGAPEFYTGGGKLALLGGEHGLVDLAELEDLLARNNPAFVHETPAHVLSLSNLTECGAALDAAATSARAEAARRAGLHVHLDGARFANALSALGAKAADLSWRAGVDVMSFGATKNGAAGCEAILLFGEARQMLPALQARAKRGGHMPPKMRYLAAQMLAYLRDGLWLELAERANRSARELAQKLAAAGASLAHPVDGNEVFARLDPGTEARLSAAGAGFHRWRDGACRFVCSWSTTPEEIAALADLL